MPGGGRPGGLTVTASFGALAGPDAHLDGAMALPDGSFRFERLRSVPYTLATGTRALGWAVLPGVQPGGESVTLQLTPGGLGRGAVRDRSGYLLG